ncbi:MAG TPA: MmcQ/YjbR family DNA-binding protein [Candidatus Limnocylindria bacterium]|nr:MmcQ/YjbR family DNA-binding protein [Candidatus Limnocylindria bacterium]
MARSTPLERVRKICLALPDTNERASHGSPTFFIRDKRSFVMYLDNHHDDGRLALWCASSSDVQQMLATSRPDQFFVPPYVGHLGWIGVRLDRDLSWDEIERVIADAHRIILDKMPRPRTAKARRARST